MPALKLSFEHDGLSLAPIPGLIEEQTGPAGEDGGVALVGDDGRVVAILLSHKDYKLLRVAADQAVEAVSIGIDSAGNDSIPKPSGSELLKRINVPDALKDIVAGVRAGLPLPLESDGELVELLVHPAEYELLKATVGLVGRVCALREAIAANDKSSNWDGIESLPW